MLGDMMFALGVLDGGGREDDFPWDGNESLLWVCALASAARDALETAPSTERSLLLMTEVDMSDAVMCAGKVASATTSWEAAGCFSSSACLALLSASQMSHFHCSR